jgi:anthranilate/para-aminobenzoate synthase component I
MLDCKQIQHASNRVVNHLTNTLRALVQSRKRREDNATHFGDCGHIAQMSKIKRRLAHHQYQSPALLEHHIGGPADQVGAGAAGDAPHRAFVTLPEGTVISASPERMVASDGHVAWSEPIKGTAAPGKHAELTRSVKNRAEHVMIVDLVRNDLGRVARPGGVSVPLLMGPLRTSYADHMVSHVRAELRDDVGPADVLRAVFPAGSVTGAPKVRALEVIREIEPVGRGPAFGSVVAVGTDGSLDASVTIRTAWLPTGVPHAQYWSGGAIVWDSDPTAERDEAWRKARPFLDALGTEAP